MNAPERFEFKKKYRVLALWVMGFGASAVTLGFLRDPVRTWGNLLVNNFYFLSLALAGLVFIAVLSLTSAGWSAGIRRIPEAMTTFLPIAGVLMLTLYFGRHSLYPWSDAEALHDPILAGKAPWLNAPFFFFRMVLFIGVWVFFALRIRRASLAQDSVGGGLVEHRRILRYSAGFIPVFAVTFSLASFDWIMSLEPHWYSTIFAVYNFSGLFLHGVAFVTLVVILLRERGYLDGIVNENHLHDLSKILFAFSIFWASMWVNQYMLIWYTNVPEETVYYVLRTDRDWNWLFILNLVLNWGVPFFILLPRASKRSLSVLKRVCIALLVGHWIDVYVMVMPPILKNRVIGPLEILIAMGYGALFVYVTARALSRAPLVARNDLYLEESLHHLQ